MSSGSKIDSTTSQNSSIHSTNNINNHHSNSDNNNNNNSNNNNNNNNSNNRNIVSRPSNTLVGSNKDGAGIGTWTCQYCTFTHKFHSIRCQMCEKLRGPSKEQMINFIQGKPIPQDVRIDPLLVVVGKGQTQMRQRSNSITQTTNNSDNDTRTRISTTTTTINPYAKKKINNTLPSTSNSVLSQGHVRANDQNQHPSSSLVFSQGGKNQKQGSSSVPVSMLRENNCNKEQSKTNTTDTSFVQRNPSYQKNNDQQAALASPSKLSSQPPKYSSFSLSLPSLPPLQRNPYLKSTTKSESYTTTTTAPIALSQGHQNPYTKTKINPNKLSSSPMTLSQNQSSKDKTTTAVRIQKQTSSSSSSSSSATTNLPALSQKTLFETNSVVVKPKKLSIHEQQNESENKENSTSTTTKSHSTDTATTTIATGRVDSNNHTQINRTETNFRQGDDACLIDETNDSIDWNDIPVQEHLVRHNVKPNQPVKQTCQSSPDKDEFDDIPSEFFDLEIDFQENHASSPNDSSVVALNNQPINQNKTFASATVDNTIHKRQLNDTIKWTGSKNGSVPTNKVDSNIRRISAQFLPYRPGPVEINPLYADTWIYPDNDDKYPRREYQMQMAESAIFHNTLVSLPTGLGKTLIAAVVMYNYYRWFDGGIVLFLAPTLPLVYQQIQACYEIMGIPQCDTHVLTGKTKSDDRAGAWGRRRVFFCTPQTVQNDLETGAVDAKRVVCVVLDEVHKATGRYSYTQVVDLLEKKDAKFRLLGLSATPGTNIKAIQQVIDSLRISKIEFRQDSDPDVAKYIHERKTEDIFIAQDEVPKLIEKALNDILGPIVEKLRKQGCYLPPSIDSVSAYALLLRQQEFQRRSNDQVIIGYFMAARQLVEVRRALSSHGIGVVRTKLLAMKENPQHGITKGIVNKPEFTALWEQVNAASFDPLQNNGTGGAEEIVKNNPKLRIVREILVEHFARKRAMGESTRAIVFSEFRESVFEIASVLAASDELKPRHFIGQSKGKGAESKKETKQKRRYAEDEGDIYDVADATTTTNAQKNAGMTQKEQQQVIHDFQRGVYNILVCTCIGEEGLDIGEVDLIVNFDALRSPIRMLQRVGRTGRKREGRVVSLILEGLEKKKYLESKQKETTLAHALRNPKSFKVHQSEPMFAVSPNMEAKKMIIGSSFSMTQNEVGKKRRRTDKNESSGVWRLTDEEDWKRRFFFGEILANVRMEHSSTERNDSVSNSRLPRALTRRLISARVESKSSWKTRSLYHRSISRMPKIRCPSTKSYSNCSRRIGVNSPMDVLFPLGDNCIANYKVVSKYVKASTFDTIPDVDEQPVDMERTRNDPGGNETVTQETAFVLAHTPYLDCNDNRSEARKPVQATPITKIDAAVVSESNPFVEDKQCTQNDNFVNEHNQGMEMTSSFTHLPYENVNDVGISHSVPGKAENLEALAGIPNEEFFLPLPSDDSSLDNSDEEQVTRSCSENLQLVRISSNISFQNERADDDFCLPSQEESSDDDSDSGAKQKGVPIIKSKVDADTTKCTNIGIVVARNSEGDTFENLKSKEIVKLHDEETDTLFNDMVCENQKMKTGNVALESAIRFPSPRTTPLPETFCGVEFIASNQKEDACESDTSHCILRRRNQKDKKKVLAIEDSPSCKGDSPHSHNEGVPSYSWTPSTCHSLCNTQVELDVVCAVCQNGESPDEDPIILCDGPGGGLSCNLAVHVTCYSAIVDVTKDDPWRCDVCAFRFMGRTEKVVCILCHKSSGALKAGVNNEWRHVICDVASRCKRIKRNNRLDKCDVPGKKSREVGFADTGRRPKEKRRQYFAKKFIDDEAAIYSEEDMDGDDSEAEDIEAIEEEEAKMTGFINDSSQLGYSPDSLDNIDPQLLDDETGVHRRVDAERHRLLQFATPVLNRHMKNKKEGIDCTPASAPSSLKGLGNMHFVRSILEHHRNGGSCEDIEIFYRKLETDCEQNDPSGRLDSAIKATKATTEIPVLMEYVPSDSDDSA